MIKYFCDVCGKELSREIAGKRIVVKHERLQIEVLTAVDGTWNAGIVCRECILEAIVQKGNYKQIENGKLPVVPE